MRNKRKSSDRISLKRKHFEILFENIYLQFIASAEDEEEKKAILKWAKDWKEFYKQLPKTIKDFQESNISSLFADSLKENRLNYSVGESVEVIIQDSNFRDANEMAMMMVVYIESLFRNRYNKTNKPSIINFGGSNKAEDTYKSQFFFWYLGYEGQEGFKKDNPIDDSQFDFEKYLYLQSNLFDREDEWVELESKWKLSGKWRVEAIEGQTNYQIPDNQLKKQEHEVKKVHKEDIKYDIRFSYWGELDFEPFGQKGFFKAIGKLKTNAEKEELQNWTIKIIAGARRSKGEPYFCLDYEMFPPENVDSHRTYGYVMLRPPKGGVRTVLRGYYLSNRMRLPVSEDGEDFIFDETLRISMGRVVFYKLDD